MKIGTAESNVREKKARLKEKLSGSLGAGTGPKNRGGGGGGSGNEGGDEDFSSREYTARTNAPAGSKFRISMWFFLLVVLMTFGVLIGAYVFTSSNHSAEWRPFQLPNQVWFSTFLILAGSLTYVFADKCLNAEQQQKAKNWLIATTVLGAAFVSSQLLLWMSLSRLGYYVESNPYAGFFYIMTAVHVVHVVGGILILGYIVLRAWQPTDSIIELERRKSISKTVGWYWHFMGALWLVLFLLLGFYK